MTKNKKIEPCVKPKKTIPKGGVVVARNPIPVRLMMDTENYKNGFLTMCYEGGTYGVGVNDLVASIVDATVNVP